MTSTLLSVDFDFFIRHGMHEETITFPDGNEVPGLLVFDWQMNEGRAPELEQAVWEIRAMNFKQWGLDIKALTAPELSTADFATEISIRCGGSEIPWWRGDSHSWAGVVARDYAQSLGPLSVVNFDAHHDLGYDFDSQSKDFKDRIWCDQWAVIGLQRGWIKNYTVVYPDWLGRWEWGERIPRPWLKNFRNRIKITTWSEWLAKTDEIRNPEVGFVCRSSSWVPPWYDQTFDDLVCEFQSVECLDCLHGQHGSAYDTCVQRGWDWTSVDEQIRLFEEAKKLKT